VASTLTIYNAADFVGIAVVGALVFRPRMSRPWLVFTFAPLVLLIGTLAWRGFRVTFGPPTEVDWIGSLIVVGLIAIPQIGYRLWLLRREQRWARDPRSAFDHQIYLVVHPLSDLLRGPLPSVAKREWVQSIVVLRQDTLNALGALRPPTAEWAGVRDSYVTLLGDDFEVMGKDENPTRNPEFLARAAAISARIRELRVSEGRDPTRG
jgi:hypothetical protein